MSDTSSSTGVQAKISRWFEEPSKTLTAKPSPEKWLWINIPHPSDRSFCVSVNYCKSYSNIPADHANALRQMGPADGRHTGAPAGTGARRERKCGCRGGAAAGGRG
ncbi:hypothetical protein MLIT_24910 [Mycolicibacterium litorale]|uniref:Uncharacterized protein n=1 Tax=Mycolicibacterium litorale TaxID=758802 RepID=A0AAD1IK52_9MYCO|nr:hypothetical protein MLIT_24910 [Mycolicibacterium litorale]